MPAPPHKGETQDSFISRCMSHLITKEGKSKDQAAGQCFGMYKQAHKINTKASKALRKARHT
uniref:Uncharacterized protein n=1 Tax=viral metagenome TaxID=1070528 RepID=A0A6M3K0T5_9ZZZZ